MLTWTGVSWRTASSARRAALATVEVPGGIGIHTCARDAWLVEGHGPELPGMDIERLYGRDAMERFFAVACGLDSAVQGEADVGRQVRAALARSDLPMAATLDHVLARLLRKGRIAGWIREGEGVATLAARRVAGGWSVMPPDRFTPCLPSPAEPSSAAHEGGAWGGLGPPLRRGPSRRPPPEGEGKMPISASKLPSRPPPPGEGGRSPGEGKRCRLPTDPDYLAIVGTGAIGSKLARLFPGARLYNRTPRPGVLALADLSPADTWVIATAAPSPWFYPPGSCSLVLDLGHPAQALPHPNRVPLDALLAGADAALSPERLAAATEAVVVATDELLERLARRAA